MVIEELVEVVGWTGLIEGFDTEALAPTSILFESNTAFHVSVNGLEMAPVVGEGAPVRGDCETRQGKVKAGGVAVGFQKFAQLGFGIGDEVSEGDPGPLLQRDLLHGLQETQIPL